MLRRRASQNTTSGQKRSSDSGAVISENHVYGEEYKNKREALLEEEVLGTEENVINDLPVFDSEERKVKKKKRHSDELEKKWEDSDDEHAKEFDTVTPSWAGKFDDEKSEDSDEEVLKSHSHNILAASVTLPSSSLDFKRVTDGNKEDPSKSSLWSVEFHPKATVLLTGGPDNTVRLFAVDGSKNRKIHSMFFEQTPVFCTHFSRGGSEIIIGSRHKSFYVYDMEGDSGVTFRPKLKGLDVAAMSKFVVSPDNRFIAFLGTYGYIHLFSQTSKELIDSVKMNGDVYSVSFSNDGKFMYTFGRHCSQHQHLSAAVDVLGKIMPSSLPLLSERLAHIPRKLPMQREPLPILTQVTLLTRIYGITEKDVNLLGEGHVYVWDMDTRDCVHHFSDEGCINGSRVTVSPDDKYIVCGSKSGIVSIYDRETAMLSRMPTPLKHIKNLTTRCSGLLFNPQSEILAITSKDAEKAIRLVHFPSMTVLPNFPEYFDNDMKILYCMDFSPSSGYLALGNHKGRCLLYRLHHYTKY